MENNLIEQRKKINIIDNNILRLLEERFSLVKSIADYKKKNKLNIFQPKREDEVLNNLINSTKKLDSMFIENLFRVIFNESKRIQKNEE